MNSLSIIAVAHGLKGFRASSLRVIVTDLHVESNNVWVMTADLLDTGTRLVLDASQVELTGEVNGETLSFSVGNFISRERAERLVEGLKSFEATSWLLGVGACPVGGSFDVVVTVSAGLFVSVLEAREAVSLLLVELFLQADAKINELEAEAA